MFAVDGFLTLCCFDRRLDIQQVAVNLQEGMELAVFREPFISPSSFEESSALPE
jgi:hypothetical protein